MGVVFKISKPTASCRGTGVRLTQHESGSESYSLDPTLGLACGFAEVELSGGPVSRVILNVSRSVDHSTLEAVIAWLVNHGRRVTLRISRRLPSSIVPLLARMDIPVVLQLAHHEIAVHRALVETAGLGVEDLDGESADVGGVLLLQAQHLRANGVPVIAELAPLLPGIHDLEDGLLPLLQAVKAASIEHVRVGVGSMSFARLQRLNRVIRSGEMLEVLRSFHIPVTSLFGGERSADIWRLKPRTSEVLRLSFERVAKQHGFEVQRCGCPFYCRQTKKQVRSYVSVVEADLFAGLGASL